MTDDDRDRDRPPASVTEEDVRRVVREMMSPPPPRTPDLITILRPR